MKVAVIPARGGSKRIPRKNLREFDGEPIIGYPIKAAQRSRLFDEVIVSTDDQEISEVSRGLGAEVPFVRPKHLCDEHTGTTPVVAHAVRWLQDSGAQLSAVCCLYATAPFVSELDLKCGLETLESGDWDYVFSATTFPFPIFRGFRLNDSRGVEMFQPHHFDTRSQDLPEALHDAGQFYWGRPDAWLSEERLFDQKSTVVMVPRWRVQDIDTPEDWERAEIMWAVLKTTSPPTRCG